MALASESLLCCAGAGGLALYDVSSDPPTELSVVRPSVLTDDNWVGCHVAVLGQVAYVAGPLGLATVDISDAASPRELAAISGCRQRLVAL